MEDHPEAPSASYSTDELISQRVNHLLFINRVTRRQAAGDLGISHSAFNTKMNGGSSWKAEEMVNLTERFGVTFDFLVGRQAIELAEPLPGPDNETDDSGTRKPEHTLPGDSQAAPDSERQAER